MARASYIRYRGDLTSKARACAQMLLVIELDGDTHFTDHGERYDRRRTASLEGDRIRVLRFTNKEVMEHFEAVCARIGEALGS